MGMMINERSKRVIPFRPHDAGRVGEACFYLDLIVWLNGDRIELGDRVAFNYGCYVNGYGGLLIGDGSEFGPYTMIHTANHRSDDPERPVTQQGWHVGRPVDIGRNCWIGMGVSILPEVTIGDSCIVGAGSVVVRDLEPYSIAVGNPARQIRSRR
jgi:acetyltransferase-like isoleucine patch superfamily enzyme